MLVNVKPVVLWDVMLCSPGTSILWLITASPLSVEEVEGW